MGVGGDGEEVDELGMPLGDERRQTHGLGCGGEGMGGWGGVRPSIRPSVTQSGSPSTHTHITPPPPHPAHPHPTPTPNRGPTDLPTLRPSAFALAALALSYVTSSTSTSSPPASCPWRKDATARISRSLWSLGDSLGWPGPPWSRSLFY